MKRALINGFSKLSPEEKINYTSGLTKNPEAFKQVLKNHFHPQPEIQKRYGEFAENTISNYFLPFNIAPNFLINGVVYHVPMVIEESSVVAAASAAAGFWAKHGGFKTEVVGVEKLGHVYFKWIGSNKPLLENLFQSSKAQLIEKLAPITKRMEMRGGGIRKISLIDKSNELPGIYQLAVSFDTADAMGANFINTVLEKLALEWKDLVENISGFKGENASCEIIMSILSNHTPGCRVKASVSAPVSIFDGFHENYTGREYTEKFKLAIDIAQIDPYRAATHNKGIFNGIDAVVLATGNDFRAIEAAGHTYAAENGKYKSLSQCQIIDDIFVYTLEVPIAVGTVGGMTNLHPLATYALEILGNPSAQELMSVIACAGLANNFSAVKALTTKGIQQGHMRMHLGNILTTLDATFEESAYIKNRIEGSNISYNEVKELLRKFRNG